MVKGWKRLLKTATDSTMLLAPAKGSLIELSAVADKAFSSGMLGPGVAFVLAGDVVCSPCSGTLSVLATTKHAFGITTDAGAEVLVHVGLDTVELKGRGLEALVKQGCRVQAGQPIIGLDRALLDEVDLTTPVVVTNPASFEVLLTRALGSVEVGDPVLRVVARPVPTK